MMTKVKSFWNDQRGVTSTEYLILLAGIAVALITATTLFRNQLINLFKASGDSMTPDNLSGGGGTGEALPQ